jgi:hypothetical protein
MNRDLLTQYCGNGGSQELVFKQSLAFTILGEQHPPDYYGS